MQSLQSELNQCLYYSSSALHRWLTRLADRHFKAVGLTPTQGFTLIILKVGPGIIMSDLAHVLQMDVSTVTKTLDKMIAAELVYKETFGRVVRVFATDAGSVKEADAIAAWKKFKAEYRRIIGSPKARVTADAISEVLDLMRK